MEVIRPAKQPVRRMRHMRHMRHKVSQMTKVSTTYHACPYDDPGYDPWTDGGVTCTEEVLMLVKDITEESGLVRLSDTAIAAIDKARGNDVSRTVYLNSMLSLFTKMCLLLRAGGAVCFRFPDGSMTELVGSDLLDPDAEAVPE